MDVDDDEEEEEEEGDDDDDDDDDDDESDGGFGVCRTLFSCSSLSSSSFLSCVEFEFDK